MTDSDPLRSLDALVGTWLSVPDFADRLGTAASNVRGALRDRRIVGVRRNGKQGYDVPEAFLVPFHLANAAAPLPAPEPGQEREIILPSLRGTVIVLSDAGLSDDDILRWLFTTEPALGEAPLTALRAGRKSAVRREAALLLV